MAANIRQVLTDKLKEILIDLGIKDPAVVVFPTENLANGDYASNSALIYAKELSKNPKELAELIKEKIEAAKLLVISKVAIAGPGFVNFLLKPEVLIDNVREILTQADNYGRNNSLVGQKIIVEFTDPNPFKEFHIGHLMTNTIGETITRILEASGAEVKRVNYQGDVGLHVAKAIWGLLKTDGDPNQVADLSAGYAHGSKAYDEDESAKLEIVELNKKLYDRSDEAINKIYDTGRKTSLDHFAAIYKKLDTHFDFNYFESETGEFGKQVVLEFLDKGVFEKSDGAVIFPGEKHGLHTRVFINKQGLPTYEAKELGLAKIKHDNYPYNQSVIITGNEVNGYFEVLLKAMDSVYPDLAAKTKHIGHGMLRLPTGKMSSRTGQAILAEKFIDEVKTRVLEKMSEDNRVIDNKEAIAEMVALGAIKYSILKQDIGRDIIFDFDKSIAFEGNSGPYLQYMHARICSVLEKANGNKKEFANPEKVGDLERLLIRYPDIISRAGEEYAPQYLVTYLFALGSAFSSYYAQEKIIGSDDEAYRVAMISAVRQVLKNGLKLLGITAPEKM